VMVAALVGKEVEATVVVAKDAVAMEAAVRAAALAQPSSADQARRM